jgi:hypothetical protein
MIIIKAIKRFILCILVYIIIYFLCACGIKSFPVLAMPIKGTSENGGFYTFYMTSVNGGPNEVEQFGGFELYYRFFGSGDSTINNYLSLNTWEEVVSNNFLRVTFYSDGSSAPPDTSSAIALPLIKVDSGTKGKDSTITISFVTPPFGLTSEPFISSTGGLNIPHMIIRRGISDPLNPGYYKAFNNIDPNDTDLKNVVIDVSGGVQLVMYVFSYGLNNYTEPLYSRAVSLLQISITLPLQH